MAIPPAFPFVGQSLPLVSGPVPLISGPVPFISYPVAFIGYPVALVGHTVLAGAPVGLRPDVQTSVVHGYLGTPIAGAILSTFSLLLERLAVTRRGWCARYCRQGLRGDMDCDAVVNDRSLVAGEPRIRAQHDLPVTLRAAGQARELVAADLTTIDSPVVAEETVRCAQLLVSELVTNAVIHARTELQVGVCCDDHTLLIAVADGHPNPPTDGESMPDLDYAESGRGMMIVASLAEDFGWRSHLGGRGKIMWATLKLDDHR